VPSLLPLATPLLAVSALAALLLATPAAAQPAPPLPASALPAGCQRFSVDIEQRGDAGIFGEQVERYTAQATLDAGTWRDVQFTLLHDDDPDQPLWDEGEWPFPLGGDHTRDAEEGDEPVIAKTRSGWRYTWSRDGMSYSLHLGPDGGPVRRQAFRAPGKVTGPDGWAKGIAWTMRQDAAGWPRTEQLTLRVGKGLLGVDLRYQLTYTALGACG
jgi:hypothetical protein